MLSVVILESIGDNVPKRVRERVNAQKMYLWDRSTKTRAYLAPDRPWVARIVGPHPRFGFDRQFVAPKRDHTNSNNNGSRGIMCHYELFNDGVYEINEPLSWKRVDRYFIEKCGAEHRRITLEQASELVRGGSRESA
jgi:hypothetical protein